MAVGTVKHFLFIFSCKHIIKKLESLCNGFWDTDCRFFFHMIIIYY